MRIGVGLSIPELATRGGRFSPASLFTSGVAGAWYDPSDINNYMAGLGPELVTNGSFSSSSNWLTTGNSSVSGGTGNLDGTAVAGLLYQAGIFSNGKCYQVEFDVVSITGTLKCWNNDGTTIYSTTTFGRKSFTYIHAIASSNFLFRADLGGNIASVDNVSVREVTTIANATLFQDSAGTTPVTAVEQPVGLMLDKSQGLVLGSELVTNGDFSGGTTGWTAGNSATLSVTGGKLSVVNGALALGQGRQTITTVAGKTYKISVTFTSVSASRGYVFVGTFAGDNSRFSAGPLTTSQTVTGYFTAAGTSTYLSIGNADNSIGLEVQFDDVTVKSLAGNHASQATAASRPVLRARYNLLTYSEQFDNAAWSKTATTCAGAEINATTAPDGTLTADKIVETTATSGHVISNSGTVGVTQNVASVYLKKGTGATAPDWIQLYTGGVSAQYANFNLATASVGNVAVGSTATITSVGNGWYRCTLNFTPGSAGSVVVAIAFTNNTDTTTRGPSYAGAITSDVFVWGADLRTGSSAGTYQRIAAATDYATAGFLPYLYFVTDDSFGTNSIDFTGTNKMSVVSGLTKLSDSAVAALAELGSSGSYTTLMLAPGATAGNGMYRSGIRDGTNTAEWYADSALVAPRTNVVSVLMDRAAATVATQIYGRVNGAVNGVNSGTAIASSSFTNDPIYIGRRGGSTLPFNGNLYGLIVCGKALSASELSATEAWMNSKTGAY